MNHQVYSANLHRRVISFIREKHSNHWYYFWSDLTLAHYADATQQFLKDKGISYIPKYDNPPAVASFRPHRRLLGCIQEGKVWQQIGGGRLR